MSQSDDIISLEFYLRSPLDVAKDLLGRHLRHENVIVRITEIEIYGDQKDSASHCRFNQTSRNTPMWETGGQIYVYLCYGIHNMLNIVTGPNGAGSAILIRSCEPIKGLQQICQRRQNFKVTSKLLTGPGKVAQALAVNRTFNKHKLFKPGGLELLNGTPSKNIIAGPRIGINFASETDRLRHWRFAIADNEWVSERKLLIEKITIS